jgi:hypothetical protein
LPYDLADEKRFPAFHAWMAAQGIVGERKEALVLCMNKVLAPYKSQRYHHAADFLNDLAKVFAPEEIIEV